MAMGAWVKTRVSVLLGCSLLTAHCTKVPHEDVQVSHERTFYEYFPLYCWLFDKDPFDGLLQSLTG